MKNKVSIIMHDNGECELRLPATYAREVYDIISAYYHVEIRKKNTFEAFALDARFMMFWRVGRKNIKIVESGMERIQEIISHIYAVRV